MNTIIVCGFILLIAIVGSIYFAVQDKKEKKAPAIWLQVLFFNDSESAPEPGLEPGTL